MEIPPEMLRNGAYRSTARFLTPSGQEISAGLQGQKVRKSLKIAADGRRLSGHPVNLIVLAPGGKLDASRDREGALNRLRLDAGHTCNGHVTAM